MFCLRNWARPESCVWLTADDQAKLQMWPCRQSTRKTWVMWVLTVVTVGFLRLFFYWKPLWQTLATCDPCEPETADRVLLKGEDGQYSLRIVGVSTWPDGLSLFCLGGTTVDVPSCRYFTFRKLIYVWHPSSNSFQTVLSLDADIRLSALKKQKGLSSSEANKRFAVFGSNEIAVDLKPIIHLFLREVFSPFYVFQAFSVGVWFSESYNYYASIIVAISCLSVCVNVWQTRHNQRKLRDMMYSIDIITVLRSNEWRKKSTTVLVPGDLILLPDQGEMHCDAVLLHGSCIVNEAMLTGESVPTTKTPIRIEPGEEGDTYNDRLHAKHTLYCGTKILQTKSATGEPVTAVVIRTGFRTNKGKLVRAIMYPKPIEFEFTRDLFRFIALFAGVALIGFTYSLVLMIQRGNGPERIALRSLDIVTIAIPPALPAAMTIGIIAAQHRLRKQQIYCTSPSSINTAGGINIVCFDKTGTLTEEGLTLYGILPTDVMEKSEQCVQACNLATDSDLTVAMACCHSLTYLNGHLAGDPMDLILFEESGWNVKDDSQHPQSGDGGEMLIHSKDGDVQIKIIREYPFSSSTRRMSVLVEIRGGNRPGHYVFCKGAPETLQQLCLPDTVPSSFQTVQNDYSIRGYRLIAVAVKRLGDETAERLEERTRANLESSLQFLGIVAFENRLKSQSQANLRILRDAEIRTVMVTGDNLLTAVSVARRCRLLSNSVPTYTVVAELVDDRPLISLKLEDFAQVSSEKFEVEHFTNGVEHNGDIEANGLSAGQPAKKSSYQLAISGSSFAVIADYMPHLLPTLVAMCDVYARMAPEQKVQVVQAMQEIGYITAMCGDGANDCGALKAAHVGISLSEAEASIASPFTSRNADIRCVPTLIREGRAALVTSFGIVKYMMLYSMCQFSAVTILYWIGSTLADLQFLYSDLFLTTTFAICFGYTAASPFVSTNPPATRILTVASVMSIISQMALVLLFQVFVFRFIEAQPWFVPYVFPRDENNYVAYQVTTVFLTTSFQQIILCIVYSKSYPYRRSLFSNYPMMVALVVTTAFTLWLTLNPHPEVVKAMDMKLPPIVSYRSLTIVLAVLNFLLAMGAEQVVDVLAPKLEAHLPWKRPTAKHITLRTPNVLRRIDWLESKPDKAAARTNDSSYQNAVFSTEEL